MMNIPIILAEGGPLLIVGGVAACLLVLFIFLAIWANLHGTGFAGAPEWFMLSGLFGIGIGVSTRAGCAV